MNVVMLDSLTILEIVLGISIVLSFILFSVARESYAKVEQKEQEIEKYEQQVQKYQQECELAKQELDRVRQNFFSRGYLKSQLQKQEELLEQLEVEKKKVQDAMKIARQANEVKDIFLSHIRHEIRTPLNSILVFSDMLQTSLKGATNQSYATNIAQAGQKLLSFVDELIELANLESGDFELHEYAVEVKSFFESIVEPFDKKAMRKNLAFRFRVDNLLPVSVKLDSERVEEILDNLIDNAIKFTSQGMVTVEVVLQHTNVTKNTVDIAVKVIDTGQGVAQKDHQKIFAMFEKRENASHEEYQSTGLRLSINKKTAQCMGGDITLQSTEGKGSIFTFVLKNLEVVIQNAATQIDEKQIDFSVLKSSSLVVIDEEEDVRNTLKESFLGTDVKVFALSTPREAIELLKQERVDLILIDLATLTEDDNAISKVLSKISDAPAVTLANRSIKEASFSNNGVKIVGHLRKPIQRAELFVTMLKLLNSQDITKSYVQNSFANKTAKTMKIDKEASQAFVNYCIKNITPLYEKCLKTNDMDMIRTMASYLLKAAKYYKVVHMQEYAQTLLKQLEMFDVDALSTTLQEYPQLLKSI